MDKKKKKDSKTEYKSPKKWIALVLVVAITVVAVFLFMNRKTDVDKMSMTYDEVFDTETLKANAKTTFKQSYELKDYTIYGETLILYGDAYSFDNVDSLLGKSVVLRNLVDGQELIYTFSGGADLGIDLSTLDEGVYEIYVYDHYKQKRAYFSEEMESDEFTTMRRNGKVKMCTLTSSKDYLDALGITFEENYTFLTIIENTAIADTYDVVIDPSGYVTDITTNEVDYGYTGDDFSEADTSYALAESLKTALEDKGLKVKITRDKEEAKAYYGNKGRAGVAYNSGAKVFIALGAEPDETSIYPYFITSPYTGGSLANELAYYLKQSGIKLTTVSDETQLQAGVMFDTYSQEYDDQLGYYVDTQYELYPQLRETGGKVTFAGTLSSAQENKMYSDSYGLYSIYFSYANPENEESIQYFETEKDRIVIKLAKGICEYFNIDDTQNGSQ